MVVVGLEVGKEAKTVLPRVEFSRFKPKSTGKLLGLLGQT